MKNIQDKHIFAVLGGDLRQRAVAKRLVENGVRVKAFALFEGGGTAGIEICNSPDRAIAGSDVIILPLPASRDNINLSHTDSGQQAVALGDVVRSAQKHGVRYILGGMIPDEIIKGCEKFGIKAIDYYAREELQKKNALPSAEGALMVAMENTDITVLGMNTLVCGYGRIGKKLAYILKRLGARVTVAARRDETLCEATLAGYCTVKTGSDFLANNSFDVIFNTVPAVIFTEAVISNISCDPLYIEIASKPGGIDLSAARKKAIRVITAPSLPGKYSPVSAGGYIFEEIVKILADGGIIL